MTYLKNAAVLDNVPQSEPLPGSAQVPNSAGGYGFQVNDWVRLSRFLILGSEGGSYYASEQNLSRENAQAVLRCIAVDGERTVREIVQVSQSGRAPKNDPAIFALSLAASVGNEATRRAALDALPAVCRTGTHLFHFAGFVDGMRGWGRGLRAAVSRWYGQMEPGALAYQAVKYPSRDGWSHRDLLRLAHPKPDNYTRYSLYHWITQGWPGIGVEPHDDMALRIIWAFEKAKRAANAGEVAQVIREHGLPREAVPTHFLNDRTVWEALLPNLPLTALIRNLATLTRVGVLEDGETTQAVIDTITDGARLKAARVHPIALLSALKTYAQGRGERGQNTWQPIRKIVDALDTAFYRSFASVEPTGKRWCLALDVSGSMSMGSIAGVPGLTPRSASAAMALVTMATESNCETVAFTGGSVTSGKSLYGMGAGISRLSLSPRQRLDDAVKAVSNLPFGPTDCALPMLWARENKVLCDVFVIYTDSETWFGDVHPTVALKQYREWSEIGAKLIVCGMVANGFTIADPDDGGMLDIVGFDTSAPTLMGDFARE